ncbi:hypothetical protein HYH03_008841 [Edaphochlamys debaryana]|uniref:Peptidase M60 domain-containing protein n=1 Tax=Edaphochlamys debaryana TaxID=47281 RepID=A0A835XXI8_9CHLO|nr:hypothetical protein HYH03_008841 [Edaphochlamys debaryana]|eukprot:KAG2492932.1 hypothetical protein HYH03_008841 [Edaphochlamys debaryana]
MAASISGAFSRDLADLLTGISGSAYGRSATCSTYNLWSYDVYPIVLGGSSAQDAEPVAIASAPATGGRVFALGHEGLVQNAGTAGDKVDRLVMNAWRWLAQGRLVLRVAVPNSGYDGAMQRLKSAMPDVSVTTAVMDMDTFAAGGSSNVDVYLIDSYYYGYTAAHAAAIKNWLTQLSMKGLFVTGHAWAWAQSHPNANIYSDVSINKVLWPLGFSLSVRYKYGFLDAPALVPDKWPYYNALYTVTALTEQLQGGAALPSDALVPAWAAIRALFDTLPARADISSFMELAPVYTALAPLRGAAISGLPDLANLAWTKLDPPPAATMRYLTNTLQLLSNVAGPYARDPYASMWAINSPFGFPVVLSKDEGAATVAATEPAGGGRVVAFGHEAMLTGCCSAGDNYDKLSVNAFRWAANGTKTIRIATIANWMAAPIANIRVALLALKDGPTDVTTTAMTLDQFASGGSANVDVLWMDMYSEYSAVHVSAILAWIKAKPNRGIIASGQSWYWAYDHAQDSVFAARSAHKVLWPLGLAQTTQGTGATQPAPSSTAPLSWLWYNAGYSLPRIRDALKNPSAPQPGPEVYATANAGLAILTAVLPARGTPGTADIVATMDAARSTNGAVAGPKTPLEVMSTPPSAFLDVAMDAWAVRIRDLTNLKPSRSAAAYPGLPTAGAAPVNSLAVTFSANNVVTPPNSQMPSVNQATWRSTGLYAPPGKLITVKVTTPAILGKGFRVQIGAHTDDLTNKPQWKRVPVVVSSWPLVNATLTIGSPMGGLIFVTVPRDAQLGQATVTITGAVRAPRYEYGKTTPAQWRATVRSYPAPWAELDSGKLTIMVPSSLIRNMSDPDPLLKHWNAVMDAMAVLGNIPTQRYRAERFLLDTDISVGWMHAGYPIMAPDLPVVHNEMLNLAYLQNSGAWGPYHEIGHQHQWADEQFSGTGEASNNVFVVYAMNVTGVVPSRIENDVTPEKRKPIRDKYFADGANWQKDWGVFVALDTYMLLAEGFGWQFYKDLSAVYTSLTFRIGDDSARVQFYIQSGCKVSKRNLVPFFAKWGFPVMQPTRDVCGAFPAWAENPMPRLVP